MKYIEPSPPVAIRPRNPAPASKLHIRTPALSADAVVVLCAFGVPLAFGVAVTVATGVGQGEAVQVPTSTNTPTATDWLLIPELLAWIQVHPAVPIV
jgi:hypothetical protein